MAGTRRAVRTDPPAPPSELLRALQPCRCRTVRRQPLPEQDWNKHGLPVTSDAINAQKWLVSPLYAWFDECTCTKVGRRACVGMGPSAASPETASLRD
jgi:hypothetical protein